MQKNSAECRFGGQRTHLVDASSKYDVEVEREHAGHSDLARWSYSDEYLVHSFVEYLQNPSVHFFRLEVPRRWASTFSPTVSRSEAWAR